MNIVTYYSSNAPINKAWIAQVVLPNGEYWGVYSCGPSEDEARSKLSDLWAAEKAKVKPVDAWNNPLNRAIPDIRTQQRVGCMEEGDVSGLAGKQHHLAGKVWLIHKVTREKIRVEPNDVRISNGEYERGGPRSK